MARWGGASQPSNSLCALHPSFKDEKLALSACEAAYGSDLLLSSKYN
jgi:hypothetical protein